MQNIKNGGLDWAHFLIKEWFITKFGAPTEPQLQSWPYILADKPVLISAPTGSGKTLAAFLACLDKLVRKALVNELQDETEVLYISPLKALSNDVQKNLLQPLKEISELAKKYGFVLQDIRVAVRTGDTPAKDRLAFIKKPPHILITTPESFYILLTAEKSRVILQNIKTVIVDEIHALANDKRGAHLLLSLERLEVLAKNSFVRIGLSATQKPLEKVGKFLAGARPLPVLINIGHARHLDLAVEVPLMELGAVASNEMWDEIYDRLAQLAQENRSTLVFVNTRRLAERIAHHLGERIGKEQVAAHHGSLSRKLRLQAETKLKNGELKVLAATASLELGIDIGTIDLVCQIGSPRSIAAVLQRIGRAGHWHGAVSKGRLFATTRDELLECAALVYAIRQNDLDELIVPEQPLDILAQQIVAACAANDWPVKDLFAWVKQAFPYENLSKETFDTVINMLSAGIAAPRGRYGAYLFYDQVNEVLKARRGSRLTAITSGGAIPENGLFTVIAEPQNIMVGTLDEDFAVESNRGDIFLLGTTSWQVERIESKTGKVIVQDAHGAPPSVPFWRGEAPARTKELSLHVSGLREILSEMLSPECTLNQDFSEQPEIKKALDWLQENTGMTLYAASQMIKYILQGRALLGAVPSQKTLIAERFFDESGGMQLVIHAPFGARINKAWGLALRKRFCRSFNFELQAQATDDGISIALTEQHSFPLSDVFNFLHPNTIEDVLVQSVLQSPLFKTRWRWDAGRALALPRFRYGKKVPPNIQRMLADDLLAAVFPDAAACQDNLAGEDIQLPQHPLIDEAMKDCLTEALDLQGLKVVLADVVSGKIKCLAVDTPLPSVFSQQILNASQYAFLDDAPLEERRARAVEMRRFLPDSILQEAGRLDPSAILEVQRQAWPDVRNADELHDVLQTWIALPIGTSLTDKENVEDWKPLFEELKLSKRITQAAVDNQLFWVAAEKMKTFLAVYPSANVEKNLPDIEKNSPEQEQAIADMLRGWLFSLGPVTSEALSLALGLNKLDIDSGLLKLEAQGLILRGHFLNADPARLEWCERRLLSRIHRLTIQKLRNEIAPVSSKEFMMWLPQWQHEAPGSQLSGESGLLEIIKQLQGLELPANAWERQIFAKRVHDYNPEMLDRLTSSGVVGWGRLSTHPAMRSKKKENVFLTTRRVVPTSAAPISFFVREEFIWSFSVEEKDLSVLSHAAKNIYAYLLKKGASFFFEMANHVHHLKSEIENGLWELAAAGLITADSFDDLRSLIDPRRRLIRRKRRLRAGRSMSSRWSILHSEEDNDPASQIETWCWILLKRYGIVCRDLLAKEKNSPAWRELLPMFRRLEDRGEIRGGRFVSDFRGEQFALPYAVESLRTSVKEPPNQ